jgi:hypothetical protein
MLCSKGKIKAYIVRLNFTKNIKAKFKGIFYGIERIVLLDFIHRLVSQKIEE